jgi:hypothetical protein
MNFDDALHMAKRLAALRGFPRGEPANGVLAECATILEDSCQDATQANRAILGFRPPRWPGVPAFRAHVENHIVGPKTAELAALGAGFRPSDREPRPDYLGRELPAWVNPPDADDATVGANILKFSDELHAEALATAEGLPADQRKALKAVAAASMTVTGSDPVKNQNFQTSTAVLELQNWAKRDGADWRRYFWHYLDQMKWLADMGGFRRGRKFPQELPADPPTASTKPD